MFLKKKKFHTFLKINQQWPKRIKKKSSEKNCIFIKSKIMIINYYNDYRSIIMFEKRIYVKFEKINIPFENRSWFYFPNIFWISFSNFLFFIFHVRWSLFVLLWMYILWLMMMMMLEWWHFIDRTIDCSIHSFMHEVQCIWM